MSSSSFLVAGTRMSERVKVANTVLVGLNCETTRAENVASAVTEMALPFPRLGLQFSGYRSSAPLAL